MATLAVTNSFSAGTTIVAADMNENFDDIEAFINTTPGVVQEDLIDAVGDLIHGDAADSVGRLAVGTNDHCLVADSTVSNVGLKWAVPTDTTKMPLAGGTFAGTVDMGDNLIEEPQIKDYSETVEAISGTKTAAFDIALADGNVQTLTVGAGTFNIGIVGALASQSNSLTLLLTNGGASTATFVAGANGGGGNAVHWAGGEAPTFTTSGVDVVCFTSFDGGTNYYGFVGGLDMSIPS